MIKNKLVKNASIYTFVSILQKGIGFILLPLYTAYLTTSEYGIISVVNAITAFLNILFLLALHGSLNRFYHVNPDDDDYLKKLFGTIFTIVSINSLILTVILVLARGELLEPFAKGIEFYPYLLLGLISSLLNPIFVISQTSLQARQMGGAFSKNNLLFFILNTTLTISFLVGFGMKSEGVLLATALTNFVFFIYTLIWFLPQIKLGIDIDILKKSMRYSLPIIPHSVSGIITGVIDRIFINNYLSTSLVGVYSVAFQFGNIVNIIALAVNQAITPWFIKKVNDKQKLEIVKTSSMFIDIYCLLTLFISLFSKYAIVLFTSSGYYKASEIVTPIAFAFLFQGVYYFYVQCLFYDVDGKGTRILPIITVSVAVINIIGNYLLIPRFGIMGAAFSTFISKLFLLITVIPVSNYFLKIGYKLKRIFIIISICFGISIIQYNNFGFEFSFLFRLAAFLSFAFLLLIVKLKDYKNGLKGIMSLRNRY